MVRLGSAYLTSSAISTTILEVAISLSFNEVCGSERRQPAVRARLFGDWVGSDISSLSLGEFQVARPAPRFGCAKKISIVESLVISPSVWQLSLV
jgi:hypothetical protein